MRVVSSVDKKLEVKPRFLEIFQEDNYPIEFPYKSKVGTEKYGRQSDKCFVPCITRTNSKENISEAILSMRCNLSIQVAHERSHLIDKMRILIL